MIEIGARDGFIIRPLEYFEKMYDELGPEHMKVLMAYYEGKPISGVIPIMYGNKTWYLYGASSNEYRNVMPNYLLYWEMIKISIARGDDMFDLRGVPGMQIIAMVYTDLKRIWSGIYRIYRRTIYTI